MNIRLSLLTIFLGGCTAMAWSQAASVEATPGELKQAVGSQTGVISLTVSGSIDAADFEFLRDEMLNMRVLDLSGCTIAAYNGDPLLSNISASAANVLPPYAFMSSAVANITLPTGLTAIGEGAFAGSSVQIINIPEGVTEVGMGAFADCPNLQTISFPASTTTFGDRIFKGCVKLHTVAMPGASAVSNEMMSGCTKLASVTLGDNCGSIGNDAFNGATALTTFAFPSHLTAIGDRAFYGASITEANMKNCDSLVKIGDWAFADCDKMADVTFSKATTALGLGCFANTSSLHLVAAPTALTEVKDFTFRGVGNPESKAFLETAVKDFGAYSLSNWTTVRSLEFPASVASFGDKAIANATSLGAIYGQKFEEVPALGQDVFAGIDQSQVTLYVIDHLVNQFRQADQWREFDIKGRTTSAEAPMTFSDENTLTAYFDGMLLHLTGHTEITAVCVYDLNGRMYQLPVGGLSNHVTVDTAPYTETMMVVLVQFADGSARALKLAR